MTFAKIGHTKPPYELNKRAEIIFGIRFIFYNRQP